MIKLLDKIKTAQNREVELLEMTSTSKNKTVLLIGVFHGDEPQGKFLIEKYLNSPSSELKIPVLPQGEIGRASCRERV